MQEELRGVGRKLFIGKDGGTVLGIVGTARSGAEADFPAGSVIHVHQTVSQTFVLQCKQLGADVIISLLGGAAGASVLGTD